MNSFKLNKQKFLAPITEEGPFYDEWEDEQKTKPNVLHYSLSNKEYINKGWTVLPEHKFMKKEKIFLPLDQKPNEWICNKESKTVLTYKSGVQLAEFKQKSISRIFYKNGKTAIDINYFEVNGHKFLRYVLRNDSDESLLAILDTLGRGAITDEFGKTRIKYNQTEGVLLDEKVGTPRSWRWFHDSERVEYENVMFDTYVQPPDEEIIRLITREIQEGTTQKSVVVSETYTDRQSLVSFESKECRIKPKPTVTILKIGKTNSKLIHVSENSERHDKNSSETHDKNSSETHDKKSLDRHEKNIQKQEPASTSEENIVRNIKVFRKQQIKPITLKINSFLALKIISRSNMYITFLHDCWTMKFDVGINLTNQCIDSYLVDPDFSMTDYEVVLARINHFIHGKNKKKSNKTNKVKKLNAVK